jgi:hypothetical protein
VKRAFLEGPPLRGPRTTRRSSLQPIGMAVALIASSGAHAASAYDDLIAPIFRARCVECHGEQKQKAKLALHTWEGLTRGSDGGPVFVAGKPGESALIERLRLPLADEEHMPPQDRPQPSAEEIALLARWVERGASQTASLADLELAAPLAKVAAELPAKLAALAKAQAAEPLWELDAAAVAKLRAPLAIKVAELQRRFPGALSYDSRTSAALHFTAAAFGRDFGDAELAALLPVRAELVLLDVSRTGVTDAASDTLAQFTALRVLRAGDTKIGDSTVARLGALRQLEALSLTGTNVTDASVAPLSKLRGLKSLRVAATPIEHAALSANLPVGPSAADLVPPLEPTAKRPEAPK